MTDDFSYLLSVYRSIREYLDRHGVRAARIRNDDEQVKHQDSQGFVT